MLPPREELARALLEATTTPCAPPPREEHARALLEATTMPRAPPRKDTATRLGKVEGGKEEEREAYMRLAVTVLAGLARLPELAADEGVVSTMPLVAEVVTKS
ncbi:neurochondrin family protein [Zea mays]|uniref:Neurochondrin family protein n=1 Tax=Zea mays TaxID=4577 RepID=A0A1D6HAF9_MAIZE|nr:neurochondrin family protein [Zea mays]